MATGMGTGMETGNRLTKAANGNGSSITRVSSATLSQRLLGTIALLSTVMGKELTPAESQLWKELLSSYPIEAVEWAAREHIKNAVYFPKPAEIISLISLWRRNKRERIEEERQRGPRSAQTERRRARGETYGWADILQDFKHLLEKVTMPESPRAARARAVLKKQERELQVTPQRRQELNQQAEALRVSVQNDR